MGGAGVIPQKKNQANANADAKRKDEKNTNGKVKSGNKECTDAPLQQKWRYGWTRPQTASSNLAKFGIVYFLLNRNKITKKRPATRTFFPKDKQHTLALHSPAKAEQKQTTRCYSRHHD